MDVLAQADAGRLTLRRSQPGVAVATKFLRIDCRDCQSLPQLLMACIDWLHNRPHPFNLVLTAATAFIFPRRRMTPLESIRPGFPEVAGEIMVPSRTQFDALDSETLRRYYQEQVDSAEAVFAEFVQHAKSAAASLETAAVRSN